MGKRLERHKTKKGGEEMIKHIIILGSSFKTGKRIALDYVENENNIKKINRLMHSLEAENASVAVHSLSTETKKWKEVAEKDPFFKNVVIAKSEKEFISLVIKDKDLSAIDVADYILTRFKCTHTRLEKLTYFCYADYLCLYKKKLFNDKIYAFKYGPVIESIYNTYKRYVYDETEQYIKPIEKIYDFPIKSRIMISEDGCKKLESIDKTLDKYKHYSTAQLVGLTHQDKTPWAFNDKGKTPYKEIKDIDILKFHFNEEC